MPEIKNTARSAPTGSLTLLACALLLAVPCLAGGGPQDKDEKKAPAKKAAQVVIKPAVLKPAVLKKADGKKLPLGEAVEALKNAIKGEETKPEAAKETAAAGKASEEGKVRKSTPAPPMFHMRDGTRLAGIPAKDSIKVKTAYGLLTVPMRELIKVRFCSSIDSGLSEKIAKLIQQLGHEEFDLREEASEQLSAIGIPALKALEEAQKSEDEEIKSRAEKIAVKLEDNFEEPDEDDLHLIPLEGEEDEVETAEFTIKGQIEEQSFLAKTRYGSLEFKRADILSIVFQEPLVTRLSFEVPGSTLAENGSWFDSQADLDDGEEFKLKASGTITLASFNATKCGPEGTQAIKRGTVSSSFKNFPTGSLLGKIGKSGKPFLVGGEYEGVVEKKGRLFLGIALKTGVVQGKLKVVLEKRTR
ncbi:MAG: hypothetical protein VYB34_11200 [Planctomycetota bacterium]|nr:hypothetical protein [Planctomycetota bacterium]